MAQMTHAERHIASLEKTIDWLTDLINKGGDRQQQARFHGAIDRLLSAIEEIMESRA